MVFLLKLVGNTEYIVNKSRILQVYQLYEPLMYTISVDCVISLIRL